MGIRGLTWGLRRLALGTLVATGSLAGLEAQGVQLQLSWVDNSGGQAYVSVERKAADGAYEAVATLAAGSATYTDAAVVSGAVYCYRVQAYDEAGASGYSNEACGAAAQRLDVAVAVAGGGVVASSPAGITCGTDCTESYASGAVVILTATPAPGAVFTGWSGGGCSGTNPCTVTGNAPVAVTATFALAPAPAPPAPPTTYTLTVSKSGPGAVTSVPAGIVCGTDCAESYASGMVVTLTAAPKKGWAFAGWKGACSGTGTCSVTLGADSTVEAVFFRGHAAK
jgi:hypothetical protein